MTPTKVGRCECCKQIQILTRDGFCYTCDAEIYHDLVLSQQAEDEAEQEAVASTERFD